MGKGVVEFSKWDLIPASGTMEISAEEVSADGYALRGSTYKVASLFGESLTCRPGEPHLAKEIVG